MYAPRRHTIITFNIHIYVVYVYVLYMLQHTRIMYYDASCVLCIMYNV